MQKKDIQSIISKFNNAIYAREEVKTLTHHQQQNNASYPSKKYLLAVFHREEDSTAKYCSVIFLHDYTRDKSMCIASEDKSFFVTQFFEEKSVLVAKYSDKDIWFYEIDVEKMKVAKSVECTPDSDYYSDKNIKKYVLTNQVITL